MFYISNVSVAKLAYRAEMFTPRLRKVTEHVGVKGSKKQTLPSPLQ